MSGIVLPGIAALVLCTLLHLLALRLFPRLGLLDHPEKYGLTRRRLPYGTGILAVLTFLIFFLWTREDHLSLQEGGLLASILLLAVTSLIDDLRGLPPALRLLLQTGIGFVLFVTGTRIYTITNPLGGIIQLDTVDLPSQFSMFNIQFSISDGPLPLWSGIFTIIWILTTTNAFNWFDGIPGQVSVLSLIGTSTLGLLALSTRVDQPDIALLAFLLAGCSLASAFFDFPLSLSSSKGLNRVVMGDTGSMFFGLMLGVLSIYAGGKVATALLAFGFPLLDALLVVIRRILRGDSPLRGNLDHLHHRLLQKGWSERQVILLTAALGSSFGITALFLDTFQKFVAILLLGMIVLGLTWYSRASTSAQQL